MSKPHRCVRRRYLVSRISWTINIEEKGACQSGMSYNELWSGRNRRHYAVHLWLIFGRRAVRYPNAALLKISPLCSNFNIRGKRCVTDSTDCIFFKRRYDVTILLEESWVGFPGNDAATQSKKSFRLVYSGFEMPPDTNTSESGNIPGQRWHDVASASDNVERSREPKFELCELCESLSAALS